MAKKRVKKQEVTRKKVQKLSASSPDGNLNDAEAREARIKEDTFSVQEVERQYAMIRAIGDAGIEQALTRLRLFRSYINEEQLQTPLLRFLEEKLPNLSIVRNQIDGQFEVQWKDSDPSLNHADSSMQASFLHHLSLGFPGCSAAVPSFGGFELSSKTVKTNLLGAKDMLIGDFVLEEPSDTQMLGSHDAFQTPGVTGQRLSVGMTPKTLRVPKPGEMLLSVHGSPLGVYKEDNMEAIQESEEG